MKDGDEGGGSIYAGEEGRKGMKRIILIMGGLLRLF